MNHQSVSGGNAMLKLLPKYNPCQLNGWLWIALLVGMVLVFYACATMPEMCMEVY
jgi:hypothetical protein